MRFDSLESQKPQAYKEGEFLSIRPVAFLSLFGRKIFFYIKYFTIINFSN